MLNAQTKTYTLDEAINTAVGNNRDINISALGVKKAGAAVDQAFGYALPSLNFAGYFSHYLEKPKMPFPDFGALLSNATYSILFDEGVIPRDDSKYQPVETTLQTFSQANNYTAGFTLTQTLFSSTVFKGIGASQTYYDLAKSELNNTVSKTVLSTQKAFYGVMLAKAVLEITNASFINAQENYDNVNALYGQGMVSEFDLLQSEVLVENLRPVVLQMENVLLMAKDNLKLTLGVDQAEEVDVTGDIVFKPYDYTNEDELIHEAYTSNFDIKSLDLKKQVDEAFIELDVAEYWPTLSAFGNYIYAGSGESWTYQNYSSFTVGLSLSMNLWQGNRTKNAVERSTLTFNQTEEQLLQLKDYTALYVKTKLQELKRVESLLEVQERIVKVAQRSYDIAKRKSVV